jgi:hypothetical protein
VYYGEEKDGRPAPRRRLKGYMAGVEGTVRHHTDGNHPQVVGRSIKYRVKQVVGLKGQAMANGVREALAVDERCILQERAFFEGAERTGPHKCGVSSSRWKTVSLPRWLENPGFDDGVLTGVGSASCLFWKGRSRSSRLAAPRTLRAWSRGWFVGPRAGQAWVIFLMYQLPCVLTLRLSQGQKLITKVEHTFSPLWRSGGRAVSKVGKVERYWAWLSPERKNQGKFSRHDKRCSTVEVVLISPQGA